jgi:Flp pilus assembly protein TadB
MTTNKQVSTIVDFFSKFFKFDTDNVQRDISEASAYKDKIKQNKTKLNQISGTEPLIQKIIMLLMAVVIVYLFGTFLGQIVHVVAFIVMVGGFGFIYYSTNS